MPTFKIDKCITLSERRCSKLTIVSHFPRTGSQNRRMYGTFRLLTCEIDEFIAFSAYLLSELTSVWEFRTPVYEKHDRGHWNCKFEFQKHLKFRENLSEILINKLEKSFSTTPLELFACWCAKMCDCPKKLKKTQFFSIQTQFFFDTVPKNSKKQAPRVLARESE